MSYNDDEELKIGDLAEDDDVDVGTDLDGPVSDDDLVHGDDEDDAEGFANLDGAEY